jgi:hypothetical protein
MAIWDRTAQDTRSFAALLAGQGGFFGVELAVRMQNSSQERMRPA